MSAVSEKLQSVINTVKDLSVVELVQLVEALKGELKLSDADLQGGGGVVMAAGPAAVAEAAAEPTEFTVTLKKFDDASKIAAIKAVREITGLGLAEAKKAVETLPFKVKEGVSKADADEIKKKFAEVKGADLEIKGV